MSRCLNALEELLLDLRDRGLISQKDVVEINKDIKTRMTEHCAGKHGSPYKKGEKMNQPNYNFHGVKG